MLKLSPRMQMAADMVRPGKAVCDVGTDHAYLPSFLIMSGISESAVASDIGTGPLENARRTVEMYHLSNKIKLRLSDGLDNIDADEADDIVICGMGGTLIEKILSRTQWIYDKSKHIVCQPMSHAEDVRRFFCTNGFKIEYEHTCEDAGHIYVAMSAVYTGEIKSCSPGYIYYGELDFNDICSAKYIKIQLERLKKRRNAIKDNSSDYEEYYRLCDTVNEIEGLLADGYD